MCILLQELKRGYQKVAINAIILVTIGGREIFKFSSILTLQKARESFLGVKIACFSGALELCVRREQWQMAQLSVLCYISVNFSKICDLFIIQDLRVRNTPKYGSGKPCDSLHAVATHIPRFVLTVTINPRSHVETQTM
jgi:hypothetical protein